jgi:hypothetical protein
MLNIANGAAVANIAVDAISDEYDRRNLDVLSDDELVRSVAAIVAAPRDAEFDSFVLHAPLELVARARLLPLVEPTARRQARCRIVSIGAIYQTYGEPIPTPPITPTPTDQILDHLIDAIDNGDTEGADSAAADLARSSISLREVVDRLAPALISKTSAAAHAPIFLSLAQKCGLDPTVLLALFRPLARHLALQPGRSISWLDQQPQPTTETNAENLLAALNAATAVRSLDEADGIHPKMMKVDGTGIAARLLGPILGLTNVAAERAVLRSSALSMLHDTTIHAPYGWTHCFTIPQAILDLQPSMGANRHYGLGIAATHVLGFRNALSTHAVDSATSTDEGPSEPQTHDKERMTALVTEASIRHDAHIAKYCLAVADASRRDTAWTDTYLSAGEKLLDVWDHNGGDSDDPFPPL